jgi:hypothetical protein
MFGVGVPPGTPKDRSKTCRNRAGSASTLPSGCLASGLVKARRLSMIPPGLDPKWKSGPDLSRQGDRDTARWRDFIAAANIRER